MDGIGHAYIRQERRQHNGGRYFVEIHHFFVFGVNSDMYLLTRLVPGRVRALIILAEWLNGLIAIPLFSTVHTECSFLSSGPRPSPPTVRTRAI